MAGFNYYSSFSNNCLSNCMVGGLMSRSWDIRWFWFESCYSLYLWTQKEENKTHGDYEDVLEHLRRMETIRPEDICGKVEKCEVKK